MTEENVTAQTGVDPDAAEHQQHVKELEEMAVRPLDDELAAFGPGMIVRTLGRYPTSGVAVVDLWELGCGYLSAEDLTAGRANLLVMATAVMAARHPLAVFVIGAERDSHDIALQLARMGLPVLGTAFLPSSPPLPDPGDFVDAVEPHPDADAARYQPVVDAMRDFASRDRWLGRAITRAESALPDALGALTSVPDPEPGQDGMVVANLATAVAALALRTERRALATAALGRALRVDPGHKLGNLTLGVALTPRFDMTSLDHLTRVGR